MKKIVLSFLLLGAFVSCKKNQLGGGSMVKGTVVHHSRFIANARVFIKFNAKEFPGTDTTVYDAKVTADQAGNYSFKCYPGDYFLFGYGFDDQLLKVVKGGVPARIRLNENASFDVGVTE